jgi:protein TonB
MILERRWHSAFVVALVLLLPAAGLQAELSDLDRVDQLDEVEVTAARIAPLPRSLPVPLPDLSTAVSLPADPFWKRGAPVMPESARLSHKQPFRDETALSHGNRTGAGYLEKPKPMYPVRATKAGWEGKVWLEVTVRPDGSVGDVKLKESSGYPLLDEAAIADVQRRKFLPAKDGGFAIPGIAIVPVRFTLTDPVENGPIQ